MSTTALKHPEVICVKRSELRQNQRRLLGRVRGRTVLAVQGPGDKEDEKYVVDKPYFDELLGRLDSLAETLQIMADRRLFGQILAVAESLEEDLKKGRL